MEMTIEEAHRILSNGLVNAPSEHEWCVAFKIAIDTMRKYQRIQAIINNAKDLDGAVKYNWLYEQIGEVLEDGKI